MTKKTAKRSLLMSALAMVMCLSMLIGSTFAWFTDSVTNGVNKIESGNLDVALYHQNYVESLAAGTPSGIGIAGTPAAVEANTELFLNEDGKTILWEPGAVAFENFRVANEGKLALKYELRVTVNNPTKTPAGLDLGDALSLYIDAIGYNDVGTPYGTTVAAGELLNDGFVLEGTLLPGETQDYAVELYWEPSDNDNDFNVTGGLKADLGVALVATQFTYEKDILGDQYDKDAVLPTPVFSAAALDEAVNNGGNVVLEKDVEADVTINAGTDVNVDLNDKEVEGVISNDGNAVISGGTLVADGNNALYNTGSAEVKDVVITGNTAAGYITNSREPDSVTIFENVDATSTGGGINVWQGKAIFKSGTVVTNSTSTSARHVFYVADGAELVIEDGEFTFNPTNLTRKGSYICAQANATVIVNGGIFHKPSTRTAPIQALDGASVTIYGGKFQFDPSAFVADGYAATLGADGYWTVAQA